MINRRSHILKASLFASCMVGAFAQSMNYPMAQVRYTAADVEDGGDILAISQPVTNVATSRWNTVIIRSLEGIAYQPELVLRGEAVVSADTRPTHLGLLLVCEGGEEGFARVPVEADGTVAFEMPASAFVPGSNSANGAPLSSASAICEIRIYASFSTAVTSTFSLESFTMKYDNDWSPLDASKRRHAHLLEGDMKIPAQWTNVHPRLYASADELDETAARYQADPTLFSAVLPAVNGPEMTGEIVPFDEGVTAQRNAIALAKLAVAYRVTGDEIYLNRIREWIPTMQSYEPPAMGSIGDSVGLTAGHILLGCSIAYDALAGQGDLELEQVLLDVILKQGQRTFEDIVSLPSFPYEQNHLIIPVCGLAVASMTVADSHPETEEWGVLTANMMSRTLDAIAHDGWFFEGMWYWNYTMQFPVAYAVTRERIMGDCVLDAPCFEEAPAYLAHMTLPDPRFVFDFADWGPRVEPDGVGFQKGYDWPWHTLPTRVKKFIPLLLLKEDPANAFLSDYIAWTSSGDGAMTGIHTIDAVFEMLSPSPAYGDKTRMDRTYPDYPPYHYFPDMEVVHWRNNWEDADATALAFKSGPPAGHHFGELLDENPDWKPSLGHAHPDAGSFILFGQGVFLANDAGYTGAKETANHNSILVDGVGQHKAGTPWKTFEGKPYAEYDQIRMENVWMEPGVIAATAVYEAAYDDAMELEAMRRHLILVDGRFLVILDELSSALPHEYEWRWHSDQPTQVFEDDRYVMTNGSGQVVIKSLNEVVQVQVAPTIVETSLFDANLSRPQQRGYHLALTSPRQQDFEFLTVACVQASSEQPEAFQVLEHTDRMVKMTDGEKVCTVWFAGAEGQTDAFAYQLCDSTGQVEASGSSGQMLPTTSPTSH